MAKATDVTDDVTPVDPLELRARALRGLGPCISKARAMTWQEVCEHQAQLAFRAGVQAAGGNRACGRAAELDESTIRDKCAGARSVQLRDVFRLPSAGIYQIAQALLDWADERSRVERTGS